MRDEKLKELLSKLADSTAEPVRQGLDEDIRHQIPQRLIRHRVTWDSFNILIDLRISKWAAAAIIIITIFLWAHFLAGWGATPDEIYQDSKLLIKYGLSGENACRGDMLAGLKSFYEDLTKQGRDVTFYGESADPDDRNAVLMHWKLSNGRYRIIFNDLSARTVSPAALIRLQSRMLKKQME